MRITTKTVLSLLLAGVMALYPLTAFAEDDSKYTIITNTEQTDYDYSLEEYSEKTEAFLGDARWKDGTAWASGQGPVLSGYRAIGCAAFAADFAKYVYNSDTLRGGSHYEGDPEQIQTGDIVYVQYTNNGGGFMEHWFVVIERDGDSLYTAEGAYGEKTQVKTDFYYLEDGQLCCQYGSGFRLVDGYHYDIEEPLLRIEKTEE